MAYHHDCWKDEVDPGVRAYRDWHKAQEKLPALCHWHPPGPSMGTSEEEQRIAQASGSSAWIIPAILAVIVLVALAAGGLGGSECAGSLMECD